LLTNHALHAPDMKTRRLYNLLFSLHVVSINYDIYTNSLLNIEVFV